MSVDTIALAEALNQRCHCITVDPARLQGCLESGPATAGIYASILRDQPNLFSSSPVFLARAQLEQMEAVIAAIESVIRSDAFAGEALAAAPDIARHDFGPRGVFLGYDFHLGHEGPQLIEINTNAGGGLLNAALARAQRACCDEIEVVLAAAHDGERVEDGFVAMFRDEWRRQRGDAPLRSIAIVDAAPETQYLYPEFLMFRELFVRAGLGARIVDPADLVHEGGTLRVAGETVDLVYNRLTDFYFADASCEALRSAYVAGDVVVTPNPRHHALYADKRHLAVLCDRERLERLGAAPATAALLAASVPQTVAVDASRRDELWRERKRWFFKAIGGFGSRAAYRGDKLTRGVWEEIMRVSSAGDAYVAQRVVPPSERTIRIDDRTLPLKLDVRNYVYDATVQLVAARLYQGQTTNFRTAGGGFAPVFTEARGLATGEAREHSCA